MSITVSRLKFVGLLLSLVILANFVDAEPVTQKESVKSPGLRQETKMERFLNGKLPIGFYIYVYNWKQRTDAEAHDLDDAIEEMARRGFNYLYVGGTSDTPLWGHLLDLCEKHHIAVVPQMDFAYLWDPKANVKDLVARAVSFIKKYKDHPALMAFSVCEEPSVKHMPALKQYYEGILQEVPDAPLHLVFNYLPQFVNMEPPYPGVMGTDRYCFWWEFGSGGGRAAPSYALNWYQSQLNSYYQLTEAYGAEFQAVFTASTLETFISPENARSSFYPGTITDKERNQYFQILQSNVKNKNLGWDQGPDGFYRFWKYYRPPVNCVRAMSWLGIMEGARSVSVWAWQPPYENMKDFAHRTNGKPGTEYINSITGWDGKGTPQLDEYAEFAGEIQRYAKLVRVMTKEYKPQEKILMPAGKGMSTAKPPEIPVFEIMNSNAGSDLFFWRSFKVPQYSGKVILIVNASVGSWSKGLSPAYPQGDTVYRIDDFGNALDYIPFKEPRKLTCILLKDMECVDIETGKSVPLESGQTMTIPIVPGGGKFLFLAPRGSDEWTRLKKQFGL